MLRADALAWFEILVTIRLHKSGRGEDQGGPDTLSSSARAGLREAGWNGPRVRLLPGPNSLQTDACSPLSAAREITRRP